MPSNRLVLRSTASPYIFPLSDIVKGSVLSWNEVDDNFIFLKGLNIQSGVVSGTDLVLNRINGTNISIDLSAFTGGTGTDTFVTGGTYSQSASTITFTNNTGGTFTVTGVTSGGGSRYVNNIIPSGLTITVPENQQYLVYGDLILAGQLDNLGNVVIINGSIINSGGTLNNSGTTTFVSFNGGTDVFVTGGTYSSSASTITFTNNTGGTFTVTGISGGTDIYTISAGLNGNTIEFDRTDTPNAYSVDLSPILSGFSGTDVFVTGGTYSQSASTITFTNNTGGTFTVTGISGGTSGTTSPAGSDTFIQFNDSGSFGANSGLTYDNTFNNFFTESKIGTKTTTLSNGITNLLGQPTSGLTGLQYNNSLSGASAFTAVIVGDTASNDNTAFIGYIDTSTFDRSFANFNPNSIQLTNANQLSHDSYLRFLPTSVKLTYDSNIINTFGYLEITDSELDVLFGDDVSGAQGYLSLKSDGINLKHDTGGTESFLSLKSDGINLKHDTGGFSNTGIYIDDNSQISMNLDNTGITQSFFVIRQSSPSVYENKFEVDTDGYVTINDLYTFPNVDGSPNQVLQTDGGGTVSWANPYIGGLFAQTGNSTTVSATTTETSIVGAGVGTLTFPANGFQVGDSFHAKIGGVISAANAELLTVRLKNGASTLATLGPIDFTTTTSEFWELEIDFTIRSLGASAILQSNGQFTYVDSGGSGTYLGSGFNTNTTIDTTSSNSLGITVQWGSTNASNAIMSDIFYLKKVY
jgi:hypothetical protein